MSEDRRLTEDFPFAKLGHARQEIVAAGLYETPAGAIATLSLME